MGRPENLEFKRNRERRVCLSFGTCRILGIAHIGQTTARDSRDHADQVQALGSGETRMLPGRATSDAPPLAITRKQYQVPESSAVEFLSGRQRSLRFDELGRSAARVLGVPASFPRDEDAYIEVFC